MNYRNKKLLEAARECPICCGCSRSNDGTVVAAHSNQLRDGKGRGLKAHDFRIAFLCHDCHNVVDCGPDSYESKLEFWEGAHRNTIAYLFLAGIVK